MVQQETVEHEQEITTKDEQTKSKSKTNIPEKPQTNKITPIAVREKGNWATISKLINEMDCNIIMPEI